MLTPDMPLDAVQELLELLVPGVPFEAIMEQYPPERFGNRTDSIITLAYRDQSLVCPTQRMLQWANAAGIPSYTFFVGSNWTGGTFNTRFNATWSSDLVAGFMPHGLELAYIFGASLTPSDHFVVDRTAVNPTDKALAEFGFAVYSQQLVPSIQNYWGSFAISGEPQDNRSGVEWQRVSSDGGMAEYLYLAPPAPKWMGGPGAYGLQYASASDCTFWAKYDD